MQIRKPKTKAFQRNIEDFVCEECEALIHGDGYRNHCSYCLTSKHVDINPGDRAEKCAGLMTVVDIILEHGHLILVHQCNECGHQKRNRSHAEDNIDTIVKMMSELQKQK